MTAPAFAVYVHWPFCLSKCPYCDFNSHVRESVDHDHWRAALIREFDHAAETEAPNAGPATSIFFGGGTPSLMQPATAEAVIARVADRWGLAADVEITLEANPTSVEAAKLADFRAAGINRVSLGVQALDDDSLKALGRQHDVAGALQAVRTAAKLFDRYSFDLIYARSGQTAAAWRDELGHALTEAGDHLSLYQLTIEPGTAFHTLHQRGDLQVPDEDSAANLYELTQELMGKAGMPAYEISNHARTGGESRHNLAYWRYENYAGIGPGAHGRISTNGETTAIRRHRAPERWLELVDDAGHGTGETLPVDSRQRVAEILMMGLRLTEGVCRVRFAEQVGDSIERTLSAQRLTELMEEGLVELDEVGLRATANGRQRLNALLAHLLD
ncbi:MAG: coproporphyrinogen III oxidase [Proteobacteria bacterium]|nr:coproporphyrinogen III oxidase [Pseudomonadota bacterium]